MTLTSLTGFLLFLAAPMLFASNMVGARWLAADMPPLTLACGRWLIAAIVLFPFIRQPLRQALPIIRARIGDLAILGCLGGALSVAPQYAAAHYTSAGHIALMFALTPVLVSLLGRLVWGVRLSRQVMIGAAVAFLGIGVATFEGSLSRLIEARINLGDVLALVAAVAWSVYTALLKRRPVSLPSLVMLWSCATTAAIVLLPFSMLELATGGAAKAFSVSGIGGMIFLALVAGIAAYFVYGKVVVRFGPARASMAMYLVPLYALGLGTLVLGEPIHLYHGAAVALVLFGVTIANLPSVQRSRPTPSSQVIPGAAGPSAMT
jgi:drug/metabolite transporter (DMT)-like permease